MAERRKVDTNDNEELLDSSEPNISFTERLRRVREERKAGKSPRFKNFFRSIIFWQIPSQLYVLHQYILPYYMEDYDPMSIYYAKFLSFYIGLMLCVNWVLTLLVDTSFTKTKDQPLLPIANNNGEGHEYFVARIQETTSNGVGDQCVYDMKSGTDGLPWTYCEKCQMNVPFRTRHCSLCKACILKKDHHCYITGCCVGLKNQRYFIVLTFYVMITGLVGGAFTINYISDVVWADLNSWLDFVFPVPVFRWMFGSLRGLHCLLIIHLYVEIVLGLVSFGFFSIQLTLVFGGITFAEQRKSEPVTNTNSIRKKTRSIFGDFWLLNFLVPMTLIFKLSDNGITWEGIKLENKPLNSFSKQK